MLVSYYEHQAYISLTVRIFTIQLKIENGVSTKISMAETAINFGSVEIKDISFLDDRSLLVLCVYSGELGYWICIQSELTFHR